MRATPVTPTERKREKEAERKGETSRYYRYCIGEGATALMAAAGREGRLTAGSLHAVNFLRMVAAHAHHARLRTVNKGNTAFLFIERREREGKRGGLAERRRNRRRSSTEFARSFIFSR